MYILTALLYEEPNSLAIGQSGDAMTQEQFNRQVRLLVKQSITEELALFRQEQNQFFYNVMTVELVEIKHEIIQNVSTELDAGRELERPHKITSSDSGCFYHDTD